MNKTPGYNIRLSIKFTVDKNGKELAHYWSPRAERWIRMSLADAKTFVSGGEADRSA